MPSEINILSVQRIYDDSASQNGSEITESVRFLVKVDDQACPPWLLLNADDGVTEIPAVGQLLDDLIVTSKSVQRRPESRLHFEVECQLSNGNAPSTGGEGIKWNLKFHVDTAVYTETVYQDANFKPIKNSAGQYIEGISESYEFEEITISFDTDVIDQNNIHACRNRLNSDTIIMNVNGYKRSFKPGTLKLKKAIQDTTIDLNKYIAPDDPSYSRYAPQYWSMQYIFEYRPYRDIPADQVGYFPDKVTKNGGKQISGFARVILDQGYAELVDTPDGKKLQKILDENLQPISTPQKLDSAGKAIAPDSEACHWIVPDLPSTREVSFAGLFRGLGM